MNTDNLLIIANMVALKAKTDPHLDVVSFEHQGKIEPITYKELWEGGQKLAIGLKSMGMEQGDYFALLIQNHAEFIQFMIASSIIGTVIVPIDPRTRSDKLKYFLNDSGSKGVVCAEYSLLELLKTSGDCSALEWVVSLDEIAKTQDITLSSLNLKFASASKWLSETLPKCLVEVVVESEFEPMELMYTSGTTGDPKGIVIPYARFGGAATHGEKVFGYRQDDRPYTGLSLTHGNAQFATLAPSLKMGLRCVISRKFTKSRLWEVIRENNCTTFTLLGGMVTAIYSEQRKKDDHINPVRLVVSAGMPATLWEKFEERYDVNILEFFGAMEGGMTVKPVGKGPMGSCGRVAPGLIAKIVNDDGIEVPRGELGEIIFKPIDGDHPPIKYLNNKKASEEKVVNGWLQSGDIATMDKDGWVFFKYRKGGGIRRNGDFINPAQVERIMSEHMSVDDVFVYGVPALNGAPGEKDIVAAIKPKGRLNPNELLIWASEKLERNMIPSYIQVVDKIPKTASEKPQERFLLEQFNKESNLIYKNI